MIVPVGASETVLVDFGIAKEFVEEKTTNIFRFGTAGYAAPEQYGQGTDQRTDIYALAATFYTLLTGIVPTDALTRSLALKQGDPLLPVHQSCPTVPVAVSMVIARAMSLQSEERYATVDEFWQALNDAIRQQPDLASAGSVLKLSYPSTATGREIQKSQFSSPAQKVWPVSLLQRSPLGPWLAILLALLLLGLSAGSVLAWQHSHTPPASAPHNTNQGSMVQVTDCSLPAFTPHAPIAPRYITTAPAYTGVITNNVAEVSTKNQSTSLCLTDVRQQEDRLSGTFSGLGFISTFQGTITQDSVQFSVPIGSDRVYAFEGGIRSMGDMAGSYRVLDKSGQGLGESGVWQVTPMKVNN